MKKYYLLIIFLFFSIPFSQKICIFDYKNPSEVKLHITDSKSPYNVKVYKVKYLSQKTKDKFRYNPAGENQSELNIWLAELTSKNRIF